MTKHSMGSRLARRVAAVSIVAAATIAVVGAPAHAQSDPNDATRRIGVGNQFVRDGETLDTAVVAVDGNATVAGTTTKSVFVIKGDAVISGRVEGSVIVVNGNARVSGRVDEDIVVLDGRAILDDGAVVRGDVSSTDEPRIERGARVSGNVDQIDVTGIFTAIGFTILGALWLAVTVSTAVLGLLLLLLFRRPFEAAAATGGANTWKSIGLGLGIAIGLPVVAVLAITTLVGLPFGLGFLGVQGLLWALGYATSALCLGRMMIKAPRSAFGAFFAGWGILRVVALIPGIGALVWIGASAFGIGALVLTALRASRGGTSTPAEAPPDPPTPVATPAPAKAAPTKTVTKKVAKKAPSKSKPKATPDQDV